MLGYYIAPMWATVQGGGVKLAGSRVTATSLLGDGQYEVDFDRDVSNCAYAVTPFEGGAVAFAESRALNTHGVFVGTTTNGNSTFSDNAFYLTVTC